MRMAERLQPNQPGVIETFGKREKQVGAIGTGLSLLFAPAFLGIGLLITGSGAAKESLAKRWRERRTAN